MKGLARYAKLCLYSIIRGTCTDVKGNAYACAVAGITAMYNLARV